MTGWYFIIVCHFIFSVVSTLLLYQWMPMASPDARFKDQDQIQSYMHQAAAHTAIFSNSTDATLQGKDCIETFIFLHTVNELYVYIVQKCVILLKNILVNPRTNMFLIQGTIYLGTMYFKNCLQGCGFTNTCILTKNFLT